MNNFFDYIQNKFQRMLPPEQPLQQPAVDKFAAEKKQIADAEIELKGDGKVYHGVDAVVAAAKKWNHPHISPIAYNIIMEEGFVDGVYKDTGTYKEPTWGVGQTKDWMGKNFFTEVLPAYEEKARKNTKDYAKLPVEAQSAVVSMAYRGDWGPKTKKFLKEGKWEQAAQEYLRHSNYKAGLKKNASSAEKAIAERMRRNAEAIRDIGRA